ncbi:M14 family metallopeptidase [Pseudoduganella chitinolytica]|uniref:M14-type cytosolic carboxypeptidase n=1 Tax=Pseudoduganella chitinolytica TaxID=34070 RepID=A0ABY8BC31_9BURK|nr:M14-type cytosolic carboxypeptidase [Pseudoduganella chitinolytica]WEF33462.1 M14-type cytosolic carboxypeptidase [Pseudoduganella chitinolytica]
MTIKISQNFDSGAIEVVNASDAANIELKLRSDSHADIHQWFHFRVQGARGQALALRFTNAGQATYAKGFEDYNAVASYDGENWFRVPTSFDGQVMTIRHTPDLDSVYYAYFEPYSWERHLRLLGEVAENPIARVSDLGSSVDGRDMNLVTIGDPQAEKKIWFIARQHPGESMAEWFVEGLIDALLDDANPIARKLLQRCVFHIVPNMNPDGSVRGNLRTNAAGANLNREWMTPSVERSPEVLCVKEKIHATGVDMFFDIHGDEALPYNFVAGNEMLEKFTPEQAAAQKAFIERYKNASPDFQDKVGYPISKYKEDMLTLASKYVGHHFGCLALTLEMPFKDNADLPAPQVGWNGARSAALGAAILQPILLSLDD